MKSSTALVILIGITSLPLVSSLLKTSDSERQVADTKQQAIETRKQIRAESKLALTLAQNCKQVVDPDTQQDTVMAKGEQFLEWQGKDENGDNIYSPVSYNGNVCTSSGQVGVVTDGFLTKLYQVSAEDFDQYVHLYAKAPRPGSQPTLKNPDQNVHVDDIGDGG